MRATYISELEVKSEYSINGDSVHHLVNVVRVEKGQELLLLNGKGLKVRTSIRLISKKHIELDLISHEIFSALMGIEVAIGIPKKEALELCLKQAVEIGYRKIYLIRSDYSQGRVPELDRLEKLLISALEQSNAAFLPELIETKWEELPKIPGIFLDSQSDTSSKIESSSLSDLLIVGPEGGFSPRELELLRKRPGLVSLHLPSPIMRTPTALAVGAGLQLAGLLD